LLASAVIAFQEDDVAENTVFPPYCPNLETIVKEEYLGTEEAVQDVERWLQDAEAVAKAVGRALTLPAILAWAASQPLESRPRASVGAMLWFWEKERERRAADVTSESDGDLSAASPARAPEAKGLTPVEAFVSCFGDDLISHRPLVLSQVKNLYRIRSGGLEIDYQSLGYTRISEFLAAIPAVEVLGVGNAMVVQVSDDAHFAALIEVVKQSLHRKAAEARERGDDTSGLKLWRMQAVPHQILKRIWELFQRAPDHEIAVNNFVVLYKERYTNDRLSVKAFGYRDVRSLMAYVPFIEKVGGRRFAKYVLKKDAVPPRATAPRAHSGAAFARESGYIGSLHDQAGRGQPMMAEGHGGGPVSPGPLEVGLVSMPSASAPVGRAP